MSQQPKYVIEGLLVLTVDDVENMIVGALEGGSNYWYLIGEKSTDLIIEATPGMKGQPFVDRLMTAIEKGIQVEIHDIEDEESVLGILTSESWAKAEKLMIEKHRGHLGNVLAGNDDASTADVFFQLAVLGDVVYG